MNKPDIDQKAKVTVGDYLTIERLIRERPSLSNLEKAVQLFPTCVMFWTSYLDFLVENPERAFSVAQKAVLHCPHVDLWKRYLNLGKSLYRLPEFFHMYETAVAEIGNDQKSADIWIEYLYFLRAIHNTQVLVQFNVEEASKLPPTAFLLPLSSVLPAGISEDMVDIEGLKMIEARPTVASIREQFHTALAVPMERLDAVWDEYQAFEQVVANAMTIMAQSIPVFPGMPPPPAALASIQATKMLSEYSNRWIQSKQGLKEVTRLYSPLNLYFAPIPLDANTAQALQANILSWRRVIAFEKTNPFKLNFKRFLSRIEFVHKQCLMSNVYVAEFWFEKFIWKLVSEGPHEALEVLLSAVENYLVNDCLLRVVIAIIYEEIGERAAANEFISSSLEHFSHSVRAVPSLLMHHIRFNMRSFGVIHGRNIFLKAIRENSIHVNDEVFIAVARLETYALKNPQGGFKILQVGRSKSGAPEIYDRLTEKLGTDLTGSHLNRAIDADVNWMKQPIRILELVGVEAESAIDYRNLSAVSTQVSERTDLVDIDISGEDGKDNGGIHRPETTRMHSYKPSMDYDEEAGTSHGDKLNKTAIIPSSLKALLGVLPHCEGSFPETDTVLKALQIVDLPAIPITSLKRFDEDASLEQIRREKELQQIGGTSSGTGSNLKRLINDSKNDDDDVIIKSDLFDDEREQREFLSALAANIHRERINYKRHKLQSINAAAVASVTQQPRPTTVI